MNLNKYSKSLLKILHNRLHKHAYAIGLNESDLKKPFVGIASTGYEGNPCNMHLNHLSCEIKKGIKIQLNRTNFNTIGVSDNFHGHIWNAFSLPSRDIIADSIETVIQAMAYDSVVSVVGCDKNMPGALMAMLRLNRPGLLVYGGTIAQVVIKAEN